MEIDSFAAEIAHEICNAECFAFTGEGPKPHSARCQATAQVLMGAFRKFGDPMQAKIERLRSALAEWKCPGCGGKGSYQQNASGRAREEARGRTPDPAFNPDPVTCKVCGGKGLHPTASAVLP